VGCPKTKDSPKEHVQLVLASRVISWGEARRVAAAIHRQAREHFGPVYGRVATVEVVPRGREDPGAWHVAIADDAASADADGWHESTARGLPLGKVFAKKAIGEPGGWSLTASHEVLELLADPNMSLEVLVYGEHGSHLYAYEICDPVQDHRYAYGIDGVCVSDFVYPAWFEPFRRRRSARFDYAGACDRPLQVMTGGYATVAPAHWARGWHDQGPSRGKAGKSRGSRRARRTGRRDAWRESAP
jgi:hypothetical protein